MEGVVRTCVGYAGGTAQNPTYRRIGDHTESIQIDFDPERVSYEELLEAFFQMRDATRPAYSTQYASLVFCHSEEQRRTAEEIRSRFETLLGKLVLTQVRVLDRFYPAEDYHQKYALRSDAALMAEFAALYPDARDFRDSTAAARVNGYVYGVGGPVTQLELEIESYGLSDVGSRDLRATVNGSR